MIVKVDNQPRIDKYLWCIRVFKTRSMATEACKKGRVKIDGQQVKPSRSVKEGEEIEVKKAPVTYIFRILAFPKNRLSAKLVPEYAEDRTAEEELSKLKLQDDFFIRRDKGTGRPTKRERRIIDKLKNN